MLKVNGKEFTVQDYASFLQRNMVYAESAMVSDQGKAEALRAMVGSDLVRDAMLKEPGLIANKDKPTREEYSAAYEKLAEKYFPIPPAPDEKAAYQYYLDHKDQYGLPDMVRVSQIQFRYPEHASEEQKKVAHDKAELAITRLGKGEDFSLVAEQMTENPLGKLPKGDLGFLVRDSDAWLKNAVKGMKAGDVTAILESPVGYEILSVTDLRPAMVSPYANVREKVIQAMKDEIQTKSRDEYIKKLAKGAKIEVVQDELKPLFPNGLFP